MEKERIGTYLLVQPIATGGMASVWLARHERLGHQVAIKILHAQYQSNPEIVRRFVDEARIQANLEHPGILRVRDILEESDKTAIVMELLRGCSLQEYLSKRASPMTPGEVVGLFGQLSEALSVAHSAGVVHRDLKPANIFLHVDGNRVIPKITDFGVAKLTDARMKTGETVKGSVFGTPQYMAPEQLVDSRNVDARADIYAMGMMMFECLCGTLPWKRKTLPELVKLISEANLPDVREYCPNLPNSLADIVMKCTSRDIGSRFANAGELLKALELQSQSVPVKQLSSCDIPETKFPTQPRASGQDRPGTWGTSTPDSWYSHDWPGSETMSYSLKQKSKLKWVGGALMLIAALTVAIYWAIGRGGDATTGNPPTETKQNKHALEQDLKEKETDVQSATKRSEPDELGRKPRRGAVSAVELVAPTLPSVPSLAMGQMMPSMEDTPAGRTVWNMLRLGWRNINLDSITQKQIIDLDISTKSIKQIQILLANKARNPYKTLANLVNQAVEPCKERPLTKQDLISLRKQVETQTGLREYLQTKARLRCETILRVLTGHVDTVGTVYNTVLSDASIGKEQFQELDTRYENDVWIQAEIATRVLGCVLREKSIWREVIK